MSDYLTYSDALEIWNSFLNITRIGELCTTICKGKCCWGCQLRGPDGCEDPYPHLACKSHLCEAIRGLLWDEETSEQFLMIEAMTIDTLTPIIGGREAQYHRLMTIDTMAPLCGNKLFPPQFFSILQDDKFMTSTRKQVLRTVSLFKGAQESEAFIAKLRKLADVEDH